MAKAILYTTLMACAILARGLNTAQCQQIDCSPRMARSHPWASFCAGSWKRVRVRSENLDQQGRLESVTVTETQTTLERISNCYYTLRIDVTVEIAGKRFAAEPQFVTRGVYGESNGQQVTVEPLGSRQLTIGSQTIASTVQKVVVAGKHSKRVSTIYCSSAASPYVVKQTTVATDAEGKKTKYQTHAEIVALDDSHRVLNHWKSISQVKTVHTRPEGKIVTMESHCRDVPGGVVGHTARHLDASGRLIKRTTLELVDYYAVAPAPPKPMRRRIIFRRRNRRR